MKTFNYYPRCGAIGIIGLLCFSAIAYLPLSMAVQDIDYIYVRFSGIRHVSSEFSTMYYLFFSSAPLGFIGVIGYVCMKVWLSNKLIKISQIGFLLPKFFKSKDSIILKYSEIKSIRITQKNVHIQGEKGSFKISSNWFDTEIEFINFSNLIREKHKKWVQAVKLFLTAEQNL